MHRLQVIGALAEQLICLHRKVIKMIKQNSKTQNKTIYADSVAVATFDSTMQPDGQAQLSLSIIDPEKFHGSEEAQKDFQSCVDSVTAESKQVMTDRSKF